MDSRQIKIVDVFDMQTRGVIISVHMDAEPLNLKIGDTIEILRPDRTPLITSVRGLEITRRQCFTESVRQITGILLDSTVAKADIPEGAILQLPVCID
jgi:hypothetical protein